VCQGRGARVKRRKTAQKANFAFWLEGDSIKRAGETKGGGIKVGKGIDIFLGEGAIGRVRKLSEKIKRGGANI